MKNVMVSLFCCVALLACESAGDQAKPAAADSAGDVPSAAPAVSAEVVSAPVVESATPAATVVPSAAVAAPSASAVVDAVKK